MFSFLSKRFNFSYCFDRRVCVGDNTRAAVIMDHSLAYKITFLYRQRTKESPNRIISRVPVFYPLSIFSNFQLYFIYFIFLHSLTTRLAVHLGKSESGSLFDAGYFVIFKVYYFDYMR